jgi:hypothetical protein
MRKNLSKINSRKHSNKLFSLSSPNIKTQKVKLIADSGATDLFVTRHDSEIILENLTKCKDFQVVLPNGDIISAVEEGTLTLSTDPVVQVTGYVFEDVDLKQSLLGLSPLTNEADCQITMDKNELVIRKNDKIIARTQAGKRDNDQLWSLEVCRHNKNAQANLSLRLESDAEYVAFSHEAFGSPAVSTFHNAVSKGYLGNYPRLTAQMISANRPNTVATAKGHLDQTRKGMWSTKVRDNVTNVKVKEADIVIIEKDTDMDGSAEDLTNVGDIAPEEEASEVVYTKIINVGFECHSDGTGRNPTESFEGNKYVLVSVYDNYIAVYDIASPGGPPTERLITMCERLMAYAAAYPENELRFYKSDMILEVQADASYLSRSKARSVVGGIAYLTSISDGAPAPTPNGAVATLSQIKPINLLSPVVFAQLKADQHMDIMSRCARHKDFVPLHSCACH